MAVSKRLRFEIFRRDNHTCQSCGASAPDVKLEPDHVVPVALGGSDRPENLRTLCEDCNAGKSATPPDAATVQQVSADAMRWSRAMQAAASGMIADQRVREANRELFKKSWHRWRWGSAEAPTYAPLPAAWEKSIDQILAAGLPVELLKDCIDTAFAYEKVKPENKFKYACGVAWRKIDKLHEAAREALELGQQTSHDDGSFRGVLVADLLEIFSARDLEVLQDHEIDLTAVKQGVPLDEDDDRDPIVNVVEAIYWDYQLDRDFMENDVIDLLLELPGGVGEHALKIARFSLYDRDEAPSADRGIFLRATMREAAGLFKVQTGLSYLAALPEDERSALMEFTRVLHGIGEPGRRYADPSYHVIMAAEAAQAFECGRYYPAMCEAPGRHIRYCSLRTAFKVDFDGCEACNDSQPEGNHSHGYCEAHLEYLVEHGLNLGAGRSMTVRDYTPVLVPEPEEPPF